MSAFYLRDTAYFDTVYALLPPALKDGVDDLLSRATRESAAKHILDQLLRFSLGCGASADDLDSREEWDSQKQKAEQALSILCNGADKGKKRVREDDALDTSETVTKYKKAKLDSDSGDKIDDVPVFTLHTVSTSSPVRKKVHITMYRHTIRFMHATSGMQESSIPLSALTRAFLIPTPGKTKPHWTVVIFTDNDQNQIIFGLDAIPPSLSTTAHPELPYTYPKGSESKPVLIQLLSRLPPHVKFQEPSTSQFRSATGEPYLDAYLHAKDGHLLFFEDGVFFGEKKPCLWIGMEDIESVRWLSATGRSFSLFVKRVVDAVEDEAGNDGEGEETEFSLIDGKNQDAVGRWVKDNQYRFGTHGGTKMGVRSRIEDVDELAGDEDTPEKRAEDSEDLDDSDFEGDSGSDGGSATSQSSDEADDEPEAETVCSGSDEDEEVAQAKQARHPLLRPGAMPKMSRAAIDAVVGIVEDDLMGRTVAKAAIRAEDDDDVDELED